MVYAFAGALVLNRSFARETAERLSGRADRLASFRPPRCSLGKALANFALLMAVELVSPAGVRAVLQRAMGAAQFWPMLLVWCWEPGR